MQTQPSPLMQLETATAHLRGLVVSEWRLARGEIASNLRAARVGLILVVFGVAMALGGFFALTGAVFLGLAALGLPAWLAALATGGALSIIAAICLWVGASRLSPRALAPTNTAEHAAETIRLVTEKTHAS